MNLCSHCDRPTSAIMSVCFDCVALGHAITGECQECLIEAARTSLRVSQAESDDIEVEANG